MGKKATSFDYELKKKIETDEEFINSEKHGYSISNFEKASKLPVSNSVAASLLLMSPTEVDRVYQEALKKIRRFLSGRGG